MSKALKLPDVVSWHDDPTGGAARGIICEHVSRPYFIEIDGRGGWVLFSLSKQDKPQFVTRGQARNVTTAKLDASRAALSSIPELKAATTETTANALQVKMLEPQAISGRRATVRLYAATTALVLWLLLLLYLWFRHQPLRATLAAFVLIFGLWTAHHLLKAVDAGNARRERITKRKQIAQAKAIVQQGPQRALVGKS